MKRLLCLLLALVMVLTLTACGTGDTGTGGKPLPDMPGKTQEPDGDPAYSDQAQADLDRLRSDLREGGYLFGADNFGYLEQGQTPGEWANAMDPATCAAYSFIPEIPDGQVVGTGGCLLCLVPVDPDATVSVNRIRWHENGDGFEQEEVLYRSETGQPVFLLVEDDPDMPGYSSVQVNIVGDSGFVDWYPTVVGGQLDLANDGQGHYRGCDIAMDGPGAGSDDMDWTPPTVQQLTCTVWDWGGPMEDGRYASGTLTLDGSDARSASLVWQYEDDAVYREIYTGTWSRVDRTLPRKTLRQAAEGEAVLLDEHTLLRGHPIRRGYVFWEEDITELAAVTRQLQQTREELRDAGDILQEESAQRTRWLRLTEENRLYDLMERDTRRQVALLNDCLTRLAATEDQDQARRLLGKIVVVGTYIKRRSNLIFVAGQRGTVDAGELRLCLNESAANLGLCGVECKTAVTAEGPLSPARANAVYDLFEAAVERSLDSLSSLLLFVRQRDEALCVNLSAACDADMTGLCRDIPGLTAVQDEDGLWYLTAEFSGEGDSA